MDEQEGLGLADYLAILRRRRWYLLLPAFVIFAVAAVVAVLLPPTYRSTATILIEQQQIPQDLVRSTVTSYADQRVQVISQRVMTTANLSEVIRKYDLYADERQRRPLAAVVTDMRSRIQLKMVSADVVDPRSGSAKKATIAFTLGFDSGSPQVAQQVTNELVSLFLGENLRNRREAAKDAFVFLGGEADRLAEEIAELEAKVARFKEEHGTKLPEMQRVNAQFLQRTEDQIGRNELETRLLEERIVLLEAELARTARFGNDELDGSSRVVTSKERLAQLELEYLQLSARVKENHPDRILLEREINTLRQQTGGLGITELETMLASARSALADRRKELADGHPDVRNAMRAVANIEEQLAVARQAGGAASQLPENPVYLRLVTQLNSARSELEYLKDKKTSLVSDLADYEARVKAAPMIEREYRVLTRDYDNAVAKYREVKAKQMEAELAQSLEVERKAERFVLIEPALVPSEPIEPNRLAILFLGLVFAGGGGLGMVILKEGTGNALYNAKTVVALSGAPPIASIPYIRTAEELRGRRLRLVFAAIAAVVLVLMAVGAVHFLVKPLDLAAYQAMQRAGWIQQGGQAPRGGDN